jgi:hypothetical protein
LNLDIVRSIVNERLEDFFAYVAAALRCGP